MAHKNRFHEKSIRGSATNSIGSLDRNSAISRSDSLVSYVRPPGQRQAPSTGLRPDTRRSPRAGPPKGPFKASTPVSFGTWSLPSPLPTLGAAKTALTCARRTVRREVLFASRGRGKGSHSPKKYFSNRRC